jgi:hypothetical protein
MHNDFPHFLNADLVGRLRQLEDATARELGLSR